MHSGGPEAKIKNRKIVPVIVIMNNSSYRVSINAFITNSKLFFDIFIYNHNSTHRHIGDVCIVGHLTLGEVAT